MNEQLPALLRERGDGRLQGCRSHTANGRGDVELVEVRLNRAARGRNRSSDNVVHGVELSLDGSESGQARQEASRAGNRERDGGAASDHDRGGKNGGGAQ